MTLNSAEDKIKYLRTQIADLQENQWPTAEQGAKLATILPIPIRIITLPEMNTEDQRILEILEIQDIIYDKNKPTGEDYKTKTSSTPPHITIIDLDGQFVAAIKEENVKSKEQKATDTLSEQSGNDSEGNDYEYGQSSDEEQQEAAAPPAQPTRTKIVESKKISELYQDENFNKTTETKIQAIEEVEKMLNKEGKQLIGIESDGNCWFHAYLKSIKEQGIEPEELKAKTEEEKIITLREKIAEELKQEKLKLEGKVKGKSIKEKEERIAAVSKDKEWVSETEGAKLAEIYDIPIRVISIMIQENEDRTRGNEYHIDEMLYQKGDNNIQWDKVDTKPKNYITIISLGDHFITALPENPTPPNTPSPTKSPTNKLDQQKKEETTQTVLLKKLKQALDSIADPQQTNTPIAALNKLVNTTNQEEVPNNQGLEDTQGQIKVNLNQMQQKNITKMQNGQKPEYRLHIQASAEDQPPILVYGPPILENYYNGLRAELKSIIKDNDQKIEDLINNLNIVTHFKEIKEGAPVQVEFKIINGKTHTILRGTRQALENNNQILNTTAMLLTKLPPKIRKTPSSSEEQQAVNKELLNAASDGKQLATALAILKGADISARNEQGATALFIAAKEGYTEVVRILLTQIQDLDTPTAQQIAEMEEEKMHQVGALYIAAYKGHTKIVEELLVKTGAQSDSSALLIIKDKDGKEIYKDGALQAAAAEDHTQVVEKLSKEANLDGTIAKLTTINRKKNATRELGALYSAVEKKKIGSAQILVEQGALKTSSALKRRKTEQGVVIEEGALIAALENYNKKIFNALLKNADLDDPIAKRKIEDPNNNTTTELGALWIATDKKNLEAVQKLLEKGALKTSSNFGEVIDKNGNIQKKETALDRAMREDVSNEIKKTILKATCHSVLKDELTKFLKGVNPEKVDDQEQKIEDLINNLNIEIQFTSPENDVLSPVEYKKIHKETHTILKGTEKDLTQSKEYIINIRNILLKKLLEEISNANVEVVPEEGDHPYPVLNNEEKKGLDPTHDLEPKRITPQNQQTKDPQPLTQDQIAQTLWLKDPNQEEYPSLLDTLPDVKVKGINTLIEYLKSQNLKIQGISSDGNNCFFQAYLNSYQDIKEKLTNSLYLEELTAQELQENILSQEDSDSWVIGEDTAIIMAQNLGLPIRLIAYPQTDGIQVSTQDKVFVKDSTKAILWTEYQNKNPPYITIIDVGNHFVIAFQHQQESTGEQKVGEEKTEEKVEEKIKASLTTALKNIIKNDTEKKELINNLNIIINIKQAQEGTTPTVERQGQSTILSGTRKDLEDEKQIQSITAILLITFPSAIRIKPKTGKEQKNINQELLRVATEGNPYLTALAILKGADISTRTSPSLSATATALYLAAEKGHSDVVRILLSEIQDLDSDIDKEIINKDGSILKTGALYTAATKGETKTLKELLKKGAQKTSSAQKIIEDKNGNVITKQGALHAALMFNNLETANMLLTEENLNSPIAKWTRPEGKNTEEEGALYLVTKMYNVQAVEKLLEKGALKTSGKRK